MKRILLLALLLLLGITPPLRAQPSKQMIKSPLTPQQALKHFRLADDRLRIELVAREPQIESPVAVAFDERGKLWVVEMRDYPNGPAKGEPPAGRIRILEDRDGDGFFEHSAIFADKLLFANGILPWKGGVIVTAAPHILYLKDTNGDGKADVKEILYEGFATQNPQLRISSPILGLDGWIYCANGLRGGQVIRHGKKSAKPINLAGMDFRFDPINDRAEAISGLGQFGNTFDDWGNRFVCDNRHHLRHIVIENRYLKRNPYLAAPGVVEDISELDDGPLSSGGKIYPISSNWTTSNLHEGRFTAACGVSIYRETLLPKPYQGAAFTCDPTGNLVHVETMQQHGATFRSRPIFKEKEFLASPDDWFRPVFLSSAPDGGLYVVDMYRAVIEHPEFMPPELKNRPDLTLGKDKGRIWRIVPRTPQAKNARPAPDSFARKRPRFNNTLWENEAWWRTMAQRVVVEQAYDISDLFDDYGPPKTRLVIGSLGARGNKASVPFILESLEADHPRVREHAVLWAEKQLATSAELQKGVIGLAADPDPRVRFQVALTLGEWEDPRIIEPLARIALAGAEDKWTRLAVASAVPTRAEKLLSRILTAKELKNTAASRQLVQELSAVIGARGDGEAVLDLFATLVLDLGETPQPWRTVTLNGLAEGMGRRGMRLHTFLADLSKKDPNLPVLEWVERIVEQSARTASDAKADHADRLAGIRLLGQASWPQAERHLVPLVENDSPQEIRLAAVRALGAHTDKSVGDTLLKNWRSYTPAVRREVTEAMFRDAARVDSLLKAIEAKRVKPGDLDALRTRQLVNHPRAEIRERARKLLADSIPADRREVLARYQKALDVKGDAKKGRDIFQKNCATCHRIAGIGIDVAPDISDTRTKTAAALLTDIVTPNAAIDNNYINYVVTTKGGRTLSGILAAETAASITLRRAEGQSDIVLRQDIDEIQSTGVSLMPEGLEKTISVAEMADLLSFLKNWRYLDGAVPVSP